MTKALQIVLLPSVPMALKTLNRLESEIQNALTFEALERAANKAAGLQREFKPVQEVADRAGEVWIAAEDKLARELARIERAKGTRGQIRGKPKGHGSSGGAIMGPPDEDDAPTYAELGVSKKRAARAKKLADIAPAKRKAFIEELKIDGKGVTPNAVLAKQRAETKREKKHAVAVSAFSAEGPFDVVVIDPPWPVQKIDRDVRPNQDAFDYPTMSPEELLTFWREDMASRLQSDCHLLVWTTQKYLPAALAFIESIDFRYVLTLVWHKAGGFQPLGLPQYNCEFAVYARRGSPVFIDTKDFPCCFAAPRREHSRKPDRFYEIVRRVTGGSRIDVFSREPREGFAQYGNEPRKFQAAE
jgi:N6-adenosine-specific RNA methylase IME4